MAHRRLLPYATLLGAQLSVGAAAIFARYALAGAGPLAVSAARLGIASTVVLLLGAVARPRGVATTSAQRAILAAAGCALAAHFATWIWSLQYTSVAISVLLVTSTPLWTATYDAVVHGRRLSRAATLAFLAGAAGIALVVTAAGAGAAPPISGHAALGAALALTGSIAFGAYLLLVREVRGPLGTLTIVRHTYTWAAVLLVAASLISRQGLPALTDTRAWVGIVALALVSQLLGHTALNASLRWFTPSAVSFATLLEPVVAAALALALFGENISGVALAGGAILLAAVAVVMHEDRLELDPS